MSIRWKLLVTIGLILAINLALGYYAAITYKRATNESTLIRDHASLVVTTALSAQVHFKKQVQEWKNILLRGHEAGLYARYLRQFQDEEQKTHEMIAELLGHLQVETLAYGRALEFLEAHSVLASEYRQALKLFDRTHSQSRIEVDRQVRGIDRRPTDLIDEVVSSVVAFKESRLEASARELEQIEQELLVAVFGLLSITLLLMLSMADKLIAQPIALATEVARRISDGDLSGEIQFAGTGEVAQLLQALKTMQSSLLATQEALRQEKSHLAQRVTERTKELNFVNEELARAAKAKDLFLATMSHELRTPLTTIVGLNEMLQDQLYGPINADQYQTLRTIDESSHHLLSLINDILDVAKIESGKIELKLDFIPVEQLVESSLSLIRPSAQRKQQRLETQIDPRVKLVYGDSRRLKQMLVNLLGNAVKFTPEQGRIGLRVTAEPEAGRVGLSVWDTGIGIAQGKFEEMFEPFVQLDSEPGRRSTGTGLGLTLVNRMALLHKGVVSVESQPGHGSCFTLRLPWDIKRNLPADLDDDENEYPVSALVMEGFRGARILLAEDNKANRDMTRDFLQQKGFEVIAAENGLKALNLARDNTPDIILMDIQLEVMSGLEVTRKLRSMPGFSQLPIIALTAMAMPGDREQCLDAGMDDYISKPLGLKELLQHIVKLLKNSKRADADESGFRGD
jgi:signal transduction histidine kinase/ActR/RegA family two-component response regulator